MSNSRRTSSVKTLKAPNASLITDEEHKENIPAIPEFVFANDGRKFYPCLYCCHAFAVKELQEAHLKLCLFRTEVSSQPSAKPKALQRRPYTKRANKQPKVQKQPQLLVQKKVRQVQKRGLGRRTQSKQVLRKTKQQLIRSKQPKMQVVLKPKPQVHGIKIETIEGSRDQNGVQPIKIKLVKLQPHQHTASRSRRSHMCNLCPAVLSTTVALAQHRREKHKKVKIYISSEKFEHYNELYKKSDGKKCPVCSKAIMERGRFIRHLYTHIDEKKFSCKYCMKAFSRNDHRKSHEKNHEISAKLNGIDLMEIVNRGNKETAMG